MRRWAWTGILPPPAPPMTWCRVWTWPPLSRPSWKRMRAMPPWKLLPSAAWGHDPQQLVRGGRSGSQAALDLGGGGVGGRGAVREEDRGDGAVAAVQLLLEPVAVAAPRGGKHGDGAGFGSEVHRDLLNVA